MQLKLDETKILNIACYVKLLIILVIMSKLAILDNFMGLQGNKIYYNDSSETKTVLIAVFIFPESDKKPEFCRLAVANGDPYSLRTGTTAEPHGRRPTHQLHICPQAQNRQHTSFNNPTIPGFIPLQSGLKIPDKSNTRALSERRNPETMV